eukprot:3644269-Pleurochrysis_carterae.AAC.4
MVSFRRYACRDSSKGTVPHAPFWSSDSRPASRMGGSCGLVSCGLQERLARTAPTRRACTCEY